MIGSLMVQVHSIVHSKDPRVGSASLVVAALVTLLVHVVGVLLGVVLGLLAVDPVHTLGLGELVNLAADEAGDELLGKSVVDFLACDWNLLEGCTYETIDQGPRTGLLLVVLVGLHGGEGGGTGSELVGELALVMLLTVVDLLVSALRFV